MKYILSSVFCVLTFLNGHAQSSVGLIAHWDMNGSANDVSGNGHNGHLNNVTPAVGISGVPNTAYYFNGINSLITVPYAPSLNLSNYTICTKVKVEGFWNGECQGNIMFERGDATSHQPGSYCIAFDDNPHDSDCFALDSTQETFWAGAPRVPPFYADNYYTPTIAKDTWYTVVFTFDDTEFKTYVNGTLKFTALVSLAGTPIGSSTDSISIGGNIYGIVAGVYQEYYKGYIDDIMLYNRVLNDTEITIYSADCGIITSQPISETVLLNHTATFSVATSISSPAYQWQENSGSGFVNLTNVLPYSGVNTATLTISSATIPFNNSHYRCIISNELFCTDTSNAALLTVYDNTAVNNVLLNEMVSVSPNPATTHVNIRTPFIFANGKVQVCNSLGQVVSESSLSGTATSIDMETLTPGLYILKIIVDNNTCYKKVLKN